MLKIEFQEAAEKSESFFSNRVYIFLFLVKFHARYGQIKLENFFFLLLIGSKLNVGIKQEHKK